MNAIDPSMSGRQTCWCACAASRALRVAAYVLTLKNTVPIDWTPHAHQSIRAGCHAIHRRRAAPAARRIGRRVDRLEELEVPRAGEEDRPGEERHGVGGRADRARVGGHHAEREQERTDREKQRDPPPDRARLPPDGARPQRLVRFAVAARGPLAARAVGQPIPLARHERPEPPPLLDEPSLGDLDRRALRGRAHGGQSDRDAAYAARDAVADRAPAAPRPRAGRSRRPGRDVCRRGGHAVDRGRRRARSRCRGRHDRAPAAPLPRARLGTVGDGRAREWPHDRRLRPDPVAGDRRPRRARGRLPARPRRLGKGVRHRGRAGDPRLRRRDPAGPRCR